jgi:anti-sigma regulatory factor (Ser/Thr protein kinase)
MNKHTNNNTGKKIEKPDYELLAKLLFENYESIYEIDMQTYAYRNFHESDSYKELKLESSGEDFFADLKDRTKHIIAEEDVAYVLKMLSRDTFYEGVRNNRYYSFIYRIGQGDEQIFHQLRATMHEADGRQYIYVGIKNIDRVIQQEIENREKLSSMRQKEITHLRAILASSAAYMEVNLSKNRVLERSDDEQSEDQRFIKDILLTRGLSSYDETLEWLCNNLVTENKKKFADTAAKDNLLRNFLRGEKRVSVDFSICTEKEGTTPCKAVFYLYKEKESKDIFAFCVIYDLTEEQRKEKEMKELEQQLDMSRLKNFTSQMQPHFLYNALGSIQEIILTDPETASDLLGHFTVHLRSCIRAMSRDELIDFESELENIKAYVAIEKMRLGDRLKVYYDIAETHFKIIPLTVQPIVENAIRHGIYQKGEKGGAVFIRSYKDPGSYVIQVEDTGVGFDTEAFVIEKDSVKKDSTGLNNLMFRLKHILNANCMVESTLGKGTVVTIKIPRDENESDNS